MKRGMLGSSRVPYPFTPLLMPDSPPIQPPKWNILDVALVTILNVDGNSHKPMGLNLPTLDQLGTHLIQAFDVPSIIINLKLALFESHKPE